MAPLVTTQEQVLTSPELLHYVFTYIAKSSKPSIARVRKQWADISIPMIWETVSSQNAISNVLLPSGIPKYDGTGCFPTVSDWLRFDGYAKHVRTLNINTSYSREPNERDERCPDKELEGLHLLASLRSQPLFPHATKLVWRLSPDTRQIFRLVRGSSPLMTSNITDFQLHFAPIDQTPSPRPRFNDYLCFAGSRMPYLRHLEISCSGWVGLCEKSLGHLLESCPNLVSVALPDCWITRTIFKILARCPIKALRSNDSGFNEDNAFSFLLSLGRTSNAFSSLADITLHICYDQMINFLNIFSLPFLRRIHVISAMNKNPTSRQVHSLVQVLSARYPETLDLNLGVEPTHLKPDPKNIDAGISLIDLEPLFTLSKLQKLRISNYYPLNFSDEDIETFVSKFSTIQSLLLNEKPSYRIKSRQTWNVIFMIAAKCPLLRELGLYVGPGPIELPSPYLTYPLPFLESYSPGFTPLQVADTSRACLFFGLLLPEGCVLNYEKFNNGRGDDLLAWKDVKKKLHACQKVGAYHISILKKAREKEVMLQ